jgi:predicted branched-subunit amino acid permease
MNDDLQWLAAAFTVANSARAVCYLPQIAAVLRSTNGARDIALLTWSMWAVNNLLGAAYTGLVAHEEALALSFLASALACIVTIAVTLAKRAEFRRSGPAPALPQR